MAFKLKSPFTQAAAGGHRRILTLLGVAILAVTLVLVFSLRNSKREDPQSIAGTTPAVNPLPGGTNTDPRQDALRQQDMADASARAAKSGASYTPDIAPGASSKPPGGTEVGTDADAGMAKRLPADTASPSVNTPPPPAPVPTAPAYAAAPVDQDAVKQHAKLYAAALQNLKDGLAGRPPVTSIMYSVKEMTAARAAQQGHAEGNKSGTVPSQAATGSVVAAPRVLIPAGRGIFAHTVTATNSDLSGQIVLEADSGPVAGDRMIASVARAGGHMNRLVLTVQSIEHQGQTLPVQGVVVAPDTMEAAVASSVDQLYLQRFVLPAAAAFVQGLGTALEMTSNTVGSIGGLGNVNYVQKLNFPQQLGVAAGAAASQVNSSMMQQMPTQPRINMAANVNVGVMFLKNVALTR
ncbi:DotG/IcmE/VirB10 family protein [Kozakia baliensis]|uniref:Type IV secretion protein DotG n=2 Tax=Kozakia baliensis TaxID=153496 RepID=A0A1D8UXS5_9PROT|nr:DotG/IcmE/VirB10 family protein [Kozakia baliensis]AOX18424.1 type IV secretion protein DotG [Kozakia baliensis]GEL65136.1 hypothetical protein KBA01_24220 [Kozakia baliensis]